MNSGAFPLFNYFWNSLRMIGVSCPLNVQENSPVKPYSQGLLFVRSILITDLVLLVVISLFWSSVCFLLSLRRLYVVRNLSISSRLGNLLEYGSLQCQLYFCVVICHCSPPFLILFGSSLFFSLSLVKHLLTCLSFHKTSSCFH